MKRVVINCVPQGMGYRTWLKDNPELVAVCWWDLPESVFFSATYTRKDGRDSFFVEEVPEGRRRELAQQLGLEGFTVTFLELKGDGMEAWRNLATGKEVKAEERFKEVPAFEHLR